MDTSSLNKKPICENCGKMHYGDYLKGTDNFFGYGKSGNKVRDFPNMMGQDKGSGKESSSNEAPKKNHFYALYCRGERELLSTW